MSSITDSYQFGGFFMKKAYIIILGGLWILAFISFIGKLGEEEIDIVTAFSNDKFLSTESHIEGVVDYGSVYMTEEDKKNIVFKIAAELGINEGYEYETVREDDVTTTTFLKKARNAITTIKVISIETQKNNSVLVLQQYIKVDIEIINSLESAVAYRSELEKIFEKLGMNGDITLTLKGNISGTLSNSEKNKITDDIIKNLDGEIVTQRRDSDIYTVYAYTDRIDEYVVNGSSKTNINIAINYDELANVTKIYMATPIINEDY